MSDLHQQVVDTIVSWALNLPTPDARSRVNLKLLFGDTATAQAVRDALHERSDDRCAYVVRGSTDTEAVRLRNERPAGVAPNAAIIYIVFWLPGQPGHERNFESLRDFRSVTLADLLTGADSFVFPEEKAIEEQCSSAAQAWAQNERIRAEVHLLAACRALRMCLRERRGGRDRSIPFVERLEDYLDYLSGARVLQDVWQQTPVNERPKVLVEAWGQALWRLSMFCLPALASVIRIHVDPSKPVPSGKDAPEARWVDALEQILAENKEIATDFAGLGESIAGHQTVRERLDALTLKIPLCQTEGRRLEARNALERFCHSGDDAALRQVEWLFLQNPADRRSASFGLKGQGLTTAEDYMRASRVGRGTRLGRETKKKIWPVFQEYRAQLNEAGAKEYVDVLRDARQVIEAKGLTLPYQSVIVDEAQDMSAEAFRLIRRIVPEGRNDLFIVGDAHQRIYRHRVSLGQCGIDIRGRGRKLKVNYRTTEEIRRYAVTLLEGREFDDLDGGADEQKGYISLTHGERPSVRVFATLAEEAAHVNAHVKELIAQGTPAESICVAARTHRIMEAYEETLRQSGLATYEIRRDSAEQVGRPGVRVATLHRIKGLEFEHVIVASANDGVMPLRQAVADLDDSATARAAETAERALLYVALTRARKSAIVTANGTLSPFLKVSAAGQAA